MAYDFYMGTMLLPVPPKKMTIKIKNTNKTYDMINTGEVNVLKTQGLTEIEFEALLPNVRYPFAVYKDNNFNPASYYLGELESLKVKKKKFQFIVSRALPDGTLLFDTNIKCSLEDYKIVEDADSDGFDVLVSISLKQYRDFGVKKCKVKIKKKLDLKKFRSSKTVNLPKGINFSDGKTTTLKLKKNTTLGRLSKELYGSDATEYLKLLQDANESYRPTSLNASKPPAWKKSKKLKKGKKIIVPLEYFK